MVFDSNSLAEKKLMILYLLNKMGIPLTKTQITDAVLGNNLLDFLTLEQCILELEEAGLIKRLPYNKKQCFTATDGGKKALEVLSRRISDNTYNIINSYISNNRESLRKESQVIAEYSKINDKEYMVTLKVIEKELMLIEIKLNVVSAKQAKQICKKWESSSEKIYSQLINSLKS